MNRIIELYKTDSELERLNFVYKMASNYIANIKKPFVPIILLQQSLI